MSKAQPHTDLAWPNGVSIVVPTYKRADRLMGALSSLLTQDLAAQKTEIVVTDNDPAGSARLTVQRFKKTCPCEVVYVHAPQPGVANARNAAMDVVRGRYIAFLDDDMAAGEHWLSTLLGITREHDAALAFLPIEARMPDDTPIMAAMAPFFSRFGPDTDSAVIDEFYGAGGSMIDRKNADLPSPVFDPAMNEVGGEDDVLFAHITDHGGRVAWSSRAIAYEDVPPHRATPDYIWTRNFAFGQSPSQDAAHAGRRAGVMKWVLIGAAQYAVHRPVSLVLKMFGRARYIHHYAKAAQGAGKIFYKDKYSPRLYGAQAK